MATEQWYLSMPMYAPICDKKLKPTSVYFITTFSLIVESTHINTQRYTTYKMYNWAHCDLSERICDGGKAVDLDMSQWMRY